MRTAIFLLSAALAIPASAARVEQIALDLERPKRHIALSFAEAAGTTVRAQLRASGTEFDPDGWAGLLWYGNEDGGIVITNTASDFGVMEWAVPASSVPTNGRYVVQILGQSGATIEEWGVGTLIVRESLSQYAMPADWMSGNAAWIAATNALALAQAAATAQQLAEAALAALHAANTALAAAITNEAALREAADDAGADALAGTNTILYAAITNEAALRVTHTNDTANPHGVTAAQIGAMTNETDAIALAALAAHAAYWPPTATASEWFTFTTNSDDGITITGYDIDGGTDVVIPDYINGWPVTTIGAWAFSPEGAGMYITSVKGGDNVTSIGSRAFLRCTNLKSVSFRNLMTLNERAFTYCGWLETVVFPNLQVVAGASPFSWCELLRDVEFEKLIHAGSILADCISLTNARLPNARTFGAAFYNCPSLQSIDISSAEMLGNGMFAECGLSTIKVPASVVYLEDAAFGLATNTVSVYFDGDAPTIGNDTFYEVPENQVTNYVTNPTATGWGATLGGMPVVRLPLYAEAVYQAGELVATTGHVAQAVAVKVDMDGGTATNLWLQGETIVSDSYTNLWWRNVFSNGWHWLVAYTNAPGGGE